MSLKKIEQVKKDKGFKIFDLIIYGVILVTVAVLFIVIFTTRNTDPLSGVRIYVAADNVFEYEFGSDPVYTDAVKVEEDGDIMKITIVDGNDKNVIQIDKKSKTVKMIEANCKGRQCLYFPEMNNNSKFIYCNPHSVRIEPLLRDLNSPDIIF